MPRKGKRRNIFMEGKRMKKEKQEYWKCWPFVFYMSVFLMIYNYYTRAFPDFIGLYSIGAFAIVYFTEERD